MNTKPKGRKPSRATAVAIRRVDAERLSALSDRTDIPGVRLLGYAIELLDRSLDDGSFERVRESLRTTKQ